MTMFLHLIEEGIGGVVIIDIEKYVLFLLADRGKDIECCNTDDDEQEDKNYLT